jgi:hypothetical protein
VTVSAPALVQLVVRTTGTPPERHHFGRPCQTSWRHACPGAARQQSIQTVHTQRIQVIHGIGDTPPIQHEILTGLKWDGRAYMDNADHTCNNWTSSSTGSEQVGHSDRIGNGSSWNSSNATKGCSQAALESSGGVGLFHCFAIN